VRSGFDVTRLLSLLVKFISSYSSRLETRTKECIKVKSIMVLKPKKCVMKVKEITDVLQGVFIFYRSLFF